MKRLLNTLYVSTQQSYLRKENEQVIVVQNGKRLGSFPISLFGNIVCMGQVSCSPAFMGMCAENGIGLAFLTENGKFLARVNGPVSGNVLLRRAQYRIADNAEASAELAKRFAVAKIINSRNLLLRAQREDSDASIKNKIRAAAAAMNVTIQSLKNACSKETTRGKEGDAAKTYFSVFDLLITGDKNAFAFNGRNRRPPMDNVNAMLSFAYTLLVHDCVSALESVGLDPAVGFLHAERPGRPSLALDIMEEFRGMVADRVVLSLINRRQVKSSGFKKTDAGGVIMNDDTRKTLLNTYQERKQEEIIHPFLDERIKVGMLPYAQSMLLARYLRGDIDGYPPFRWR